MLSWQILVYPGEGIAARFFLIFESPRHTVEQRCFAKEPPLSSQLPDDYRPWLLTIKGPIQKAQ